MTRTVLPPDFEGARSYEETVADLLHVSAHPARNEARLSLWRGDEEIERHGRLALGPDRATGGYRGYLDEEHVFTLTPGTFRSCRLETQDDDDYYTMQIELGDVIVRLSDGYNYD